jgi:hypothetical protein
MSDRENLQIARKVSEGLEHTRSGLLTVEISQPSSVRWALSSARRTG